MLHTIVLKHLLAIHLSLTCYFITTVSH